jgi:hypothetical protein
MPSLSLSTMAHTCNSSYLGDRDWENCDSNPAQAKRPPSQQTSYKWWDTSIYTKVGSQHGQKNTRPYLKHNLKAKR